MWNAFPIVVYSNHSGISLNRGHCIKGSRPLTEHAISKIVHITNAHSHTSKCFERYIVFGVALVCWTLNRLKYVLHNALLIPYKDEIILIYEYVDCLNV